jgi:hypothetical protein
MGVDLQALHFSSLKGQWQHCPFFNNGFNPNDYKLTIGVEKIIIFFQGFKSTDFLE